ncbi:hypothetical protein J1614_001032 [Plenodomus biglobosus]|nr:hypothetical protein J1614_001032 [Plenodomus biglobosus]
MNAKNTIRPQYDDKTCLGSLPRKVMDKLGASSYCRVNCNVGLPSNSIKIKTNGAGEAEDVERGAGLAWKFNIQ